eukprot:CAMPEP_0175628424 /NCGR_PEP_ID=MMETSP0096-20121207/71996_1 /TAXON_ID=311494 /ORGANISM="Alexandrium monilatum, Strain CCMP3105" /LENGTH=58 /DNA_ID=CAMNT_0016933829 /DNA_START=81 /DNA_END=253 /DNA_ORIENTATION=+
MTACPECLASTSKGGGMTSARQLRLSMRIVLEMPWVTLRTQAETVTRGNVLDVIIRVP